MNERGEQKVNSEILVKERSTRFHSKIKAVSDSVSSSRPAAVQRAWVPSFEEGEGPVDVNEMHHKLALAVGVLVQLGEESAEQQIRQVQHLHTHTYARKSMQFPFHFFFFLLLIEVGKNMAIYMNKNDRNETSRGSL